jgi:hypothetical protein
MNSVKKLFLLLGLLLAYLFSNAQNDRHIETIFADYGKQKGSILIELGKDVLGGHTKIRRYKSLIVPSDSAIVNATLKAIQQDIENGSILQESKKDGAIETGYYCLKKQEDSSANEYILFTHKAKKMTLIYIRGNFRPDQLEEELDKLKNLFIKVNNKRIKL